MSTAPSPDHRTKDCPLCGAPSAGPHSPFCSQGCKDRDLIAWLSDSYRVPGPQADEMSEESAQHGLDSER